VLTRFLILSSALALLVGGNAAAVEAPSEAGVPAVSDQAEAWFQKGLALANSKDDEDEAKPAPESEAGETEADDDGEEAADAPAASDADSLEALRWFLRAAYAGHPRAQIRVALALQRGDGVERDVVQSNAWLRKAADQGMAKAMLELGIAYRDGIGVPVDPERAFMWLSLAQMRGSGVVRFVVPTVRSKLTDEQATEAVQLANAWLAERNLEHKRMPAVRTEIRPNLPAPEKAPSPGGASQPEAAEPAPGG
jgi:TPR repeat protein